MNGSPNKIRAADAKEVGVKNPAEETFCHPNQIWLNVKNPSQLCQLVLRQNAGRNLSHRIAAKAFQTKPLPKNR